MNNKNSKFQSSEIVKFKNSDGTLNGGAIVTFNLSTETGQHQAVIRNFDNKTFIVDVHKLIRIKHQIVGKASAKFIERIKEEIAIFNKGVLSNPDNKKHQEEVQLWINKYNERMRTIDELRAQVNALQEQNASVTEEYNKICAEEAALNKEFEKFKANHQDGVNRENQLSLIILGLKKAMLAGAEGNSKEQLDELLSLITDLAEIK